MKMTGVRVYLKALAGLVDYKLLFIYEELEESLREFM
jgi:hypothetical protein